ncbi:hypothetical protein [Paraburkholderia caribensis]|uniref:hypothetical protein n=1 Tax=Paraburkholderia caribensis TaxID=75105 RepID=UPI001CB62C45|nr:hypothetical protein [Paraburkholderia caribensis]CAG9269412.1 hypothetical protein PCAR4_810085 [Paraburkholderia caribensis]
MISDLETAKQFHRTLLSITDELNRAFDDAGEVLLEPEKKKFGNAIHAILNTIVSEGLVPLQTAHPSLITPDMFGAQTQSCIDELPDCSTQLGPGLVGYYQLESNEHTKLGAPYIGFEMSFEVVPGLKQISLTVTKPPHRGVNCVEVDGKATRLEPMKTLEICPLAFFSVFVGTGSEILVKNESGREIGLRCRESSFLAT